MNKVPIVAISDNKLAFALATLFISLLETKNNDTFYELNALVSPDFSQDNIDKIKSIEDTYKNQCSINIIVMDNRFDNIKNGTGRISNACAYKFSISEMFPHYDKVIYLDTDILVFEDLNEMYNIDIGDNYIGGVYSFRRWLINKSLIKRLDIPDLFQYVQAGVLIFNLSKIREDNIIPKCLKLIGSFFDSVDQHIFNKVCYGHIKLIPPKYNVCIGQDELFFNKSEIAFYAYRLKDIEEACSPVIYHYARPTKPWNTSKVKYSSVWYRYYSKSPYKDEKLNFVVQHTYMKTIKRLAVEYYYKIQSIFSAKKEIFK